MGVVGCYGGWVLGILLYGASALDISLEMVSLSISMVSLDGLFLDSLSLPISLPRESKCIGSNI